MRTRSPVLVPWAAIVAGYFNLSSETAGLSWSMPGSFGSRERSTGVQGPTREANLSRVRCSTSVFRRCSQSAGLAALSAARLRSNSTVTFSLKSCPGAIDLGEDLLAEDGEFDAELAFLATLAVLRIQAAEQLQRMQCAVGAFPVAALLRQPDAVDQVADAHGGLGEVEHDGRRPPGQSVGEDFPRRRQPRRLPGGHQAVAVDVEVLAAAGEDAHRVPATLGSGLSRLSRRPMKSATRPLKLS